MSRKLSRDDVESSFRSLEDEMGGAGDTVVPFGVTVAAAAVAGAVGLAYMAGARAAKKVTTTVEIHRS